MSERVVVAIDVGGTKTIVARVGLPGGRILRQQLMPTPAPEATGPTFLEAVAVVAEQFAEAADGAPCAGIGIGVCELVGRDGAIDSGYRVRWQGLPVLQRFQRIAPTQIGGDVHVAALAEARLGAGRRYRDFLYVNIGTGVSSAIVLDGAPRRGAHGHALVIASSPLPHDDLSAGDRPGLTLEALAGGAGLVQRYQARCGRAVAGAADVVGLAASGDPVARRLIDEAAAALGGVLAMTLGMLDPDALVVGGGLGAAPGPYWQALVAAVRQRVWSPATRQLPIVQAEFGTSSGLIGAALLAVDPI